MRLEYLISLISPMPTSTSTRIADVASMPAVERNRVTWIMSYAICQHATDNLKRLTSPSISRSSFKLTKRAPSALPSSRSPTPSLRQKTGGVFSLLTKSFRNLDKDAGHLVLSRLVHYLAHKIGVKYGKCPLLISYFLEAIALLCLVLLV